MTTGPAELRRRLLRWYDRHRRVLPWRRTHSHYRIWLSEIMLIQTQVETAIPYYRRFLQRFPTMRALAGAELGEVLKLWEGLGYYSRARNLHRTAQIICAEYRGRLPRDPQALRALPGVGEYVAGAIRSIAFNEPVPAIDGNVRRVVSRLHDLASPTPVEICEHAAPLVRGKRPGDVNQALMDLASTICTPRKPACANCPLRNACQARARGTTDERPGRKPARPRPHRHVLAGVVSRKDGAVLLARRPPEGLLGGLWEFPGDERNGREPLSRAVVRSLVERTGLRVEPGRKVATVKHAFSHFTITLHAYRCEYLGGRARPVAGYDACEWVRPEDLGGYALPTAHRRVLDALD